LNQIKDVEIPMFIIFSIVPGTSTCNLTIEVLDINMKLIDKR